MTTLNFHPGGYRDEADRRDLPFAPKRTRLPGRVDLSRFCGAVYQQYRTESCSANALASALTLLANQSEVRLAPPSRLFMYYNARLSTGTQGHDTGTTIRTAIKALARSGVCPEREWPFLKREITARPPRACYRNARVLPLEYRRIRQDLRHLHAALAEGHAFVFGMQAYIQPFTEAAKSGRLRLPNPRKDTLCGGHALIAVGYDAARKTFLARNSLGAGFARDGFFTVPDAYFTDAELTYDFWLIGGSTGW